VRAVNVRFQTRGFSIVEALVALVVLSIGMLGIAALYVESLRAGRSAIYRTQAVNLASDMADRIRSNRTAGNAYQLAVGDVPNPTATCVGDTAVECDPAELAADDLARWLAAIDAQLPGDADTQTPNGSIVVTPAAPPTRQYSIQVTWSEPGEDQNLSYVLNMQI
jgi:type IV pilus assembly protein PilV